jgi:hypothetical protein
MGTWRDEIDEELKRLRRLASQLTDQRTLDGIEVLIADLVAKEVELDRK